MNFSIIIIIIVIVSILVTLLLNYIFKRKRFIKYIPVLIMLSFMIYYFIAMKSPTSEGFEDLANFVMALLILIASLPSLICSVILDAFHARKKRNK